MKTLIFTYQPFDLDQQCAVFNNDNIIKKFTFDIENLATLNDELKGVDKLVIFNSKMCKDKIQKEIANKFANLEILYQ